MYTSLFSLAPYLNQQPTSPHPQTVGIRHTLTSQGSQHFGCGMGNACSSILFSPTPTSDRRLDPSCLHYLLWSLSGSHTLDPVPSSQRQSSLISPIFTPCTLTMTSPLKPASHCNFNGWSAGSNGIWGKKTGSLNYPSPLPSSISWLPSIQHHPASATLTILLLSALPSQHSCAVVSLQLSKPHPLTQPPPHVKLRNFPTLIWITMLHRALPSLIKNRPVP